MNRIYLLQPDGTLRGMEEAPYDSEALLQGLLERYPDLLGGDQMGAAPRRWLLISREHGVPDAEGAADRWSLDHLFVDQDAVPTLVEVKRSSDTRIRREVVGQMLDYAANAVVYWPGDDLRAKFEARCEAAGIDPAAEVASLLQPSNATNAVEDFWASVRTNLKAGRIRLVFVADAIPSELRRIVEFLNDQMDPAEVLALELRQFVGEGFTTLVPKLVGQTAAAQQRKGTTRRDGSQWTEERFFEVLREKKGEAVAGAARRVVDWLRPRVSSLICGRGTDAGSIVPSLNLPSEDPAYFFALWTYGKVEMYFQYLKDRSAFAADESRREFIRRLNTVPGIALPDDAIGRRPSFPIDVLVDRASLEGFLGVIEWALNEAQRPRRAPPP